MVNHIYKHEKKIEWKYLVPLAWLSEVSHLCMSWHTSLGLHDLSFLQLVILPYIYSTALCCRHHLSGRRSEHSQVFRRDTKYVFYSLVVNVFVPHGWKLSDGGYNYDTYQQCNKQDCYNKQEPSPLVWFLWY